MRLARPVALLLIAAALAGCAGTPAPSPVVAAPPPPADLDTLAYGGPAPFVPRQPLVIPAAAPAPVPAAVLPGPAPGGEEPYTLDSGDRLRVVVFGQEGLSNLYIVDAT